MDSNSLLTSLMQLAERSKRNLRAAPGQIADQVSNFVPDWKATSAAVPSAVKSSAGKTSEEVFKKAIEETAGNAIPGGAAGAGMFVGNTAAGRGFSTTKVREAYKLVREGATEDELWKKLQVYFGPDGKTRQEISDFSAVLKDPGYIKDGIRPRVSDYLNHPQLETAYPDIFNYSAFAKKPIGGMRGSFDPNSNQIIFPDVEDPGSLSTLLHEIQHAIQKKEGFAKGGNKGMFPPQDKIAHRLILVEEGIKDIAAVKTGRATKRLLAIAPNEYVDITTNTNPADLQALFKLFAKERRELKQIAGIDAFESYMRLYGEAEARATQARQGMTLVERGRVPPSQWFDRPIDKLIIRK